MFYVEITVKDEQGNVVIPTQRGPVVQPIGWKAPPNKPIIVDRGGNNGAYLLWHFLFQPGVTLDLTYRNKLI